MEQCDFNYHDILGSELSCPCWRLRLVVIHNRKHVASSWLGYVGILKKCDCTSYHVEIRWTPQNILYHKQYAYGQSRQVTVPAAGQNTKVL